ncbi:hypothetical protein GF319_09425 [Candidatus Bathyarchaeota archaeon]|nr:hypothetical protein [Candidatus Bathyarchaeota archaeon]
MPAHSSALYVYRINFIEDPPLCLCYFSFWEPDFSTLVEVYVFYGQLYVSRRFFPDVSTAVNDLGSVFCVAIGAWAESCL